MYTEKEINKMKKKIIKKLSKDKNYKYYNIENIVGWVYDRISNSEYKEILVTVDELLPVEYMDVEIIKNEGQLEKLEDYLMVYGIIKSSIYEFGTYFSKCFTLYWDYLNTHKYNHKFYVLNELYKKSSKRIKRINTVKTTGKVLGTIAISPILILGAVAKAAWEETESPKEKQIYYYCKLCGTKDKDVFHLTHEFCAQKTRINRFLLGHSKPGYHELYEGAEKEIYTCKHCGRTSKSFSGLVTNICPIRFHENGEKYKSSERAYISMCEPML